MEAPWGGNQRQKWQKKGLRRLGGGSVGSHTTASTKLWVKRIIAYFQLFLNYDSLVAAVHCSSALLSFSRCWWGMEAGTAHKRKELIGL